MGAREGTLMIEMEKTEEELYRSNLLSTDLGGLETTLGSRSTMEDSNELLFCFLLRNGGRIFGRFSADARKRLEHRLCIHADAKPEAFPLSETRWVVPS